MGVNPEPVNPAADDESAGDGRHLYRLDDEEKQLIDEHRRKRALARAAAEGVDPTPVERQARRVDLQAAFGNHPALAAALAKVQHSEDVQDDAEVERRRAAEARREVEKRQALVRYQRYTSTVPTEYAKASVALLTEAGREWDKVRGWWALPESKVLILAGGPGVGKTFAGYAICNDVAAADVDLRAPWATNVRAIGMGGFRALTVPPSTHEERDEVLSRDRKRALADLHDADLLLLDDVTTGHMTAHMTEQLHRLLDHRNSNGKRTIMTVNARDPETATAELVATLGAPIVDRMHDRAVRAWISGQSRRRTVTVPPTNLFE